MEQSAPSATTPSTSITLTTGANFVEIVRSTAFETRSVSPVLIKLPTLMETSARRALRHPSGMPHREVAKLARVG